MAPFFVRLASKFSKSANMTKKNVFRKNSIKISKTTEFHADFESVGKVVEKCTKKSYKQNKFDEHE